MPSSTDADDGGFKLYRYDPSIAIAVVASVLFAIATAVHCWKMYRSRARFLTPLVIGGFFEIIGYAGRAYSASQTPNWRVGPYVIQSILPLVAPALFAGSIYMILGRIIFIIDGEAHSIIRRKWLTKIFVVGDIIAFMVQAGGSGFMSAGGTTSMKTGENIVVAGLVVQILFFGLFIIVALILNARMRQVPTQRIQSESMPWQRHLYGLYASSTLIMIRSIFRVIEFVQGNDGYLFRHEGFLYIFDALLMLVVLILSCWIYPGELKVYIQRAKEFDLESRHVGTPINLQESPSSRQAENRYSTT